MLINTFRKIVDKHAPLKRKTLRGNQAPFMTRELRKAIYNRSRLKNKQESRNGVKNHTFPANQIFHEQLCISTIMNFQWYHLNSFKNCLMNIPKSLVKF